MKKLNKNRMRKITDNYIEYEDGTRYNIIPIEKEQCKIADAPGIRDFMIKHNVLIFDTPDCKHQITTINGQDFLTINETVNPDEQNLYASGGKQYE